MVDTMRGIDFTVIAMPRKASDQVITHRIEMGAWEREHIGKPVATAASNASLITSGAMVVGAGGVVLGAWALYWFFDAVYGIGEVAKEFVKRQAIPFVKPPPDLTDEEKANMKEMQDSDDFQLWEWMKEAGDSDNWKIPFTY